MNDKIKDLQWQIEREQHRISNCSHEFGDTYSDPIIKSVPSTSGHYEGHGSDPYWVPDGYDKKEVAQWSRKCIKCGLIQSTTVREPVVTSYKPKFNG